MLKSYIKRLLVEAEKAHSEYERVKLKGVRDKDWADWYAGFILGYLKAAAWKEYNNEL